MHHCDTLIIKRKVKTNGKMRPSMELYIAAEMGDEQAVSSILQNHPEIVDNQEGNGCGWTTLMAASAGDHLEVVRVLVEANAMLDLKSADGYTALMLASKFGHLDVVQVLVNAGADTELQNNQECTALALARICRHDEVEHFLEEALEEASERSAPSSPSSTGTFHEATSPPSVVDITEDIADISSVDTSFESNHCSASTATPAPAPAPAPAPTHSPAQSAGAIAPLAPALDSTRYIPTYEEMLSLDIIELQKLHARSQQHTREINEAIAKRMEDIRDQQICIVCASQPINCALVPCGHLVLCTDCASKVTECPLDRQLIQKRVQVYGK
uniref:RING-type domain-containing protein n=1 Tax=Fibrocapsa japonica TaxID=94617 RepID=A0A7S2V1X5_9STRA|mmetsp:Transcript_3451/g.5094  ORF Transcript_3451/g.5094 Transcript_3451/m.5094 type:complete len:329 (+) Transcript_3451:35-1021(+)